MKFFVQCMLSKKGTKFYLLRCDVGSHVINLSMENDVIADFADIKISDLYKMKENDVINIKIPTGV